MEIKSTKTPLTFSDFHHMISAMISFFFFLILPITTNIILYEIDVDVEKFGFNEEFIETLAIVFGVLFSFATYTTNGKWIGTKCIKILTSPITYLVDLINKPIYTKNKNKYPSLTRISNFIIKDIETFKKINSRKRIYTDRFKIIFKNKKDENTLLLILYQKDNQEEIQAEKIFSLKIDYSSKKINYSNMGYIIPDEDFYKDLEINAEDLIVKDILNGLKKIIIKNEEDRIKKIKDVIGHDFQLKYKIENTNFQITKSLIESKFNKEDDLYLKDTKVKLLNILNMIENQIQSETDINNILSEMQDHYLIKIFQTIDLYKINKSEELDQSECKKLLSSWLESLKGKINITTSKHKEILEQDLKNALIVEEKILNKA